MGCTWHPDRDAIGVCVVCRKTICGDCATDVDGIQRCEQCLVQLAEDPLAPAPGPPDRWTAGRAVGTVAGWAVITLGLWGLFEVILSIG